MQKSVLGWIIVFLLSVAMQSVELMETTAAALSKNGGECCNGNQLI